MRHCNTVTLRRYSSRIIDSRVAALRLKQRHRRSEWRSSHACNKAASRPASSSPVTTHILCTYITYLLHPLPIVLVRQTRRVQSWYSLGRSSGQAQANRWDSAGKKPCIYGRATCGNRYGMPQAAHTQHKAHWEASESFAAGQLSRVIPLTVAADML